jgi:hypothetical protein
MVGVRLENGFALRPDLRTPGSKRVDLEKITINGLLESYKPLSTFNSKPWDRPKTFGQASYRTTTYKTDRSNRFARGGFILLLFACSVPAGLVPAFLAYCFSR